MKKERLLKLADLLEADAKNKTGLRFDMGNWGTITDPTKPVSCGTTACAMGLAALSGAFKRAGLGYRISGEQLLITMHDRVDAMEAAEKLFGISYEEAEYLFIDTAGEGARGERAVAKQIRKFVARGGLPKGHWALEKY